MKNILIKITFIIFMGTFFSFSEARILSAKENLLITENDWVIGDPDAPVTMIEYASLSCPHCAAFHKNTFPIIKKEYIDTGIVKFIFRDYPLNYPALEGSMIARCAGQKMHAKYISTLFNLQKKWVVANNSKELLFDIVKNGGITQEEFDKCLANKELENQILNDLLYAQKTFNIKTTPSFIINGKLIEGNKSVDKFRNVIENILTK